VPLPAFGREDMKNATDLTVTREIAEGARVHPEARVGPFCTIGPEVVVGAGTVLESRVSLLGRTTVGSDNLIQAGCVLGSVPQDLKYRGRPTYLIIGDRNRLGPNVTAHVGTEAGGYLTRIGNGNVLEAGAHVAHDCYVDDHTRLCAGVLLAGHIRVEDGAVIEETAGVHHFTTIGRFARVGARTPVRRDVPPFALFASTSYYDTPAAVRGVHEEGLASAGLSEKEKDEVRRAVTRLFEDEQALSIKLPALLEEPGAGWAVRALCQFCQRSLAGHFGRHRETLRGKMPPEARTHLPPEAVAEIAAWEGETAR
jgi:UDP-N-acetylglucosamine acyltransferase